MSDPCTAGQMYEDPQDGETVLLLERVPGRSRSWYCRLLKVSEAGAANGDEIGQIVQRSGFGGWANVTDPPAPEPLAPEQ